MPYDSGERIPGGYTMIDTTGVLPPRTVAETPYAANLFNSFAPRQEQSAPLAMGGGEGASMSRPAPPPSVGDAAPDMTGGGAGASGGGYSTKNQQMVVQGASTGEPAPVAQSVSYAERSAAGAPAAPVDPNTLVGTSGGGGAARGPAVGPNDHDDAAELARRERDWFLQHPNGGGSGPKPGTYQTGQAEKVKVNGGKDPDSVLEMAESNREKAFADRDAAQAAAAHEADVEKRMQFERFLQQGADDNLARKRKEAMDTFHADLEAREKEINETKIDPDHFWADKSTGQKIAFVLASALTGALNGRAGIQGNGVITAVNKRIDEDINAQVRNLGTKKEGLTHLQRVYQQAKEKWGDEGIARNQAKLIALTAAEKTARQQASLTRGDAAAAAADKFYSDVANERAKLIFNSQGTVDREVDKNFKVVSAGANGTGGGGNPYTKARQAQQAAGSESDASQKYNAGPDKKGGATQRYVVGGTTFEAPNSGTEEGAKVRTVFSQSDAADALVNRIEQRKKDSVFERSSHTASAAQKEDIGRLTEIESIAKGQGVVKEPDIQRKMDAMLSVRSGDDAIKSTRQFFNDLRTSALKQAGAVPVKAK